MEIALYRPEIPPNTGNIARLSVCTSSRLHIIDRPSFSLDEASVRRAGLDYWHQVNLQTHSSWDDFKLKTTENNSKNRILLFTKYGENAYSEFKYKQDDILVFGRETSGLPSSIITDVATHHPERILRIPVNSACRSLNLANAVAIVVYEALRQLDFPGVAMQFDQNQ